MAFFGTATTNGPLVVTLSKNGITSDATNGIDWGATAPAGATGQEAAINAILGAAATAAGNAGVRIVWDVAVALGGPVYLYSNMTIHAPSPQCGVILRASANCPIFRTHGTETAPSSNTSTQSQKNFGKIDSTAFGTTTGSTAYQYRVFDSAFINAKKITVEGGTWNANYSQQTATLYLTTTYGFLNTMQFWGVDGVTVRGIRSYLHQAYNLHFVNCRRVLVEDCDIESLDSLGINADCVHFNGPCQDIRINRLRTHCTDDNIALNADDGATASGSGGSLSAGVNWACSGAITGVRVNDLQVWGGIQGTTGLGGIRMLSTVARIDDVVVKNVSCPTGYASSHFFFEIGIFTGSLLSGAGNLGRITLDDVSADYVNTGQNSDGYTGPGFIGVKGFVEFLELRHRWRSKAQNAPDIYLPFGAAIKNLRVSGDWYQPVGSTNNEPVVQVDGGTVTNLSISGRSYRDVAVGAAPFLLLTNAGVVTTALLDVDANAITNVVQVTSGSIGTLVLRGAHRNAGGGSPVALAAGTAITNIVAGSGGTPSFIYDHANVALVSGTGTISRSNDYGEGVIVATSYTLTDGGLTSGVVNTALTLTLTPVGGVWPTSEVITLASTVAPTTTFVASSGCTVASGNAVTVTAGSSTPAVVTWTPTATGTATISATSSPVMTNPTSLTYTVNSATPATTFSVGISHNSGTVGASETLTVTPISGTWPSGRTLAVTQSVTLFSVGSFSQPTAGTATAVTIPLTVTAAGGPSTINVTDSGTSAMTSTGGQTYTATAVSLMLDSITSPVKGAYSLRKLRSGYAGAAVSVRRVGAATGTQDIGFDASGNLDTAALLAYVNNGGSAATGNNGFVVTWYDQSGNGRDITNATTTTQPYVALNGALFSLGNGTAKPTLAMTGAQNGQLGNTSFSLTGSAIFASAVGQRSSNDTNYPRMVTWFGSGQTRDDLSANAALLISYNTQFRAFQNGIKSVVSSTSLVPFQATSVFDGSNSTLSVDGVTGTAVAATGALVSPGQLWVGGHGTTGMATTDWWTGYIAEVIVGDGTYSSGDQTTVRNSQKAYYGTP